VPILQSLDITARTAGNVVIEDAILKVRAGVERGENFVDPLKATNVFPHMVGQMIGVGEQTGALDAMLGKIADFYEDEVDSAIADLLALIEPCLIAFLGVTIGSIVISMYLPLFSLIGKLSSPGESKSEPPALAGGQFARSNAASSLTSRHSLLTFWPPLTQAVLTC